MKVFGCKRTGGYSGGLIIVAANNLNEAFETFKGNYGESLKDLVDPYKKLFGEDYDLERSLYDDLKATEGYGSEGFDEAGVMKSRIDDLKARLDAVRAEEKEIKDEIKAEEGKEASDVEENTKEEIPEEQLAEELKKAMDEGGNV